MAVISLMTDFGTKDGHVGVMKGVILGIAPGAQIVDLSHGISPQSVLEAALILSRTYSFFPKYTIFVIVVDPGVGTVRRPIAGQIGNYSYVVPDNGILTPILQTAKTYQEPIKLVHLNRPEYWLSNISNVFHGRDIFAPAGAHLAAGKKILDLGDPIDDPILIKIPTAVKNQNGLTGEVIHVDNFGNISTSIRRNDLESHDQLVVRLGSAEINGLYHTFGELPPGELMALLGSTDYLIISEVNGNAENRLQVKIGDPVEVIYRKM